MLLLSGSSFSQEAIAIKTWKLLNIHGGFHPMSSTLRLYVKRKEGGQELVSVITFVQNETKNIQEYIRKMATQATETRERRGASGGTITEG